MTDRVAQRQKGLEALIEVYGDDLGFAERLENLAPEREPFALETLEHLFGEIWSRPGLSIRDRRLLVLGVTAAYGRADLAETQLVGALKSGDFTRGEIGEMILQLAFYTGWPGALEIARAASAAVARLDGR